MSNYRGKPNYDRPPRGNSYDSSTFIAALGSAIGVALIVPLIMTIWWGVQHLFGSGTRYPYDQDRWQMLHWFVEGWNFFGGTPQLWLFFALTAFACAVVFGAVGESDGYVSAAFIGGLVAIVVCIAFAVPGIVSRDKVPAQFYQRATTWYVNDPANPPAAIRRLVQGGRHGAGGCDVKPIHDVPSCVKKGVLSSTPGLWQGRSSSYGGAKTVLESFTANQQGADLMEPSLTYLGGETPDTERWTGIIDGSGAYNPAQGVIEWYGKTGQIKKCLFNDHKSGTTGYKFNRSFGGAKHNSLSHLILSSYHGYVYDDGDVWGKCDGARPVIYVPMAQYKPFHHQMFKVPAGVLEIRGSQDGDPALHFHKDVKAGELGGPAVPTSIVERQRETLDWAAGRKYRKSSGGNNGGFGFDVSKAETQAGNDSEYRLYNTAEHRWYFVTTLTPNNPKSETYTAIALTPSDEIHQGALPTLRVYVLDDDPAVQVNVDRLHAEALSYLGDSKPFFRQNGGELTEIVPLGGDMWRIYGEVKGYTRYYIDMSATGRTPATTVEVNNVPGLGTPPVPPGSKPLPQVKVCEKAPKDMSTDEKRDCVKALVDSLADGQKK